ncbi:MAG TPA: hypothetical protein VHL80_07920 [Polyangia bacterium]|nr:hypothetical protein [Polyangia bacterium]
MLAVVALVFALPQLAGYAVGRLWPRARMAEWLGAVVAGYTALWYPTFGQLLRPRGAGSFHGGLGPMLAWTTLLVGLLFQLVIAAVLATAFFRRQRPPAPPAA